LKPRQQQHEVGLRRLVGDAGSRVCVFWTKYDDQSVREWKSAELRRGRLRQGWGGAGQQLVAVNLVRNRDYAGTAWRLFRREDLHYL